MKFSMFDSPLKVYGIYNFDKTHVIERLPKDLRDSLNLSFLGQRTPGARVAFRTDSESLRITLKMNKISPDPALSIFSCQSIGVYTGRKENTKFLGLVTAYNYSSAEVTCDFQKSSELEDVLLLFPRNEVVEDVIVEIDNNSRMLSPTPYTHEKPMLFFGSSITEGGCCESVANSYTALLSKWLDSDYYNYGFSGGCKGQLEFADFFSDMDLSVFIYDYDHNAPSAEFLSETHEPFFKRLRSKKPDLPVVFLTAPNYDHISQADERRAIIRKTFENAVENGDKNVYFIDGKDYFGTADRENCTVDACHPNDLGFYRMAKTIYPVIKDILLSTAILYV